MKRSCNRVPYLLEACPPNGRLLFCNLRKFLAGRWVEWKQQWITNTLHTDELYEGQAAMEEKVPLHEIKIDPLARELATSEDAQPYLNYFMTAYSNNAAGIDAALQTLNELPLKKRYTWRVLSALKSGIRRLR
ncbi:MAG: hypothetical protein WAM13_20945 [Candidatus Sulfotelmatobacter sp.]